MNLSPEFGGFMAAPVFSGGVEATQLPLSRAIFGQGINRDLAQRMDNLNRGEFGDIDPAQYLIELQRDVLNGVYRAQTLSGIPIRENLEAEVSVLTPIETPLRNRLPRVPGSSASSNWEQQTALGGGYGVSTTVATGASSATQTFASTAGMVPGGQLYFATSNAYRTISSVTNGTVAVMTSTISTTTSEVVSDGAYSQPGGNPQQAFFAETGAPANTSATYTKKTAYYKLMGTMGSITGLAMAAGATFANQLAMEKQAAIWRTMLSEENALINSSSTIVQAPYGDGSNPLGYDGLLSLTTSGNGVPLPQLQSAVGALTTAHIDAQLTRQWAAGAIDPWILLNGQEAMSLLHLAQGSGSIIRMAQTPDKIILGGRVGGYMHPITGQEVPILVSRFMPAGTIEFGCDRLPNGRPALDVDVLPQVQLPELAPGLNIQGYVAQEIAPTAAAPQVYPFLVSVISVLRMKGSTVFCKSTGVTAV